MVLSQLILHGLQYASDDHAEEQAPGELPHSFEVKRFDLEFRLALALALALETQGEGDAQGESSASALNCGV